MQSDRFEWDDEKARTNIRGHGIAFADACYVFEDPFLDEDVDLREEYGEERVIATGLVGEIVLVVVYCVRGARVRIISARRARKREQQDYFQQRG